MSKEHENGRHTTENTQTRDEKWQKEIINKSMRKRGEKISRQMVVSIYINYYEEKYKKERTCIYDYLEERILRTFEDHLLLLYMIVLSYYVAE